MARLVAALCVVSLCWLVPEPIPACSLCTSLAKRETLGKELDSARLVVFGYAAKPRLNSEPGALPGSGATDFHIEKIIKNDPILGDAKSVTLERYVPVLDPKNPPRFVIFCEVVKGKLDPYLGRQTNSAAVVDYLLNAKPERAKGKVAALHYYAKFLDHPDAVIADDAFLEFARSRDEEVGQAAKKLSPMLFRTLLQNPKLDADRVSLYAFLLGNCGTASDADFLRKRIEQVSADDAQISPDDVRSLDGLLGGYIALRPKEGWQLVRDILGNPRHKFLKKYAAMRAARFYMGWQPADAKVATLAAYRLVVADGEMADLAIEDLRRWKLWDLTPLILAQYGKATHESQITKRGILRYALCCPLPEARRFVEKVRVRESEAVRELTEWLEFEQK